MDLLFQESLTISADELSGFWPYADLQQHPVPGR
jgi:hypothetical protein